MARLRTGRPTRFPTPEEAAAHEFSAAEEAERQRRSRARRRSAGPRRCGRSSTSCVERTAADELMITTMVHDHDDRIRSYELIAETYELTVPDTVGAGQTMEAR